MSPFAISVHQPELFIAVLPLGEVAFDVLFVLGPFVPLPLLIDFLLGFLDLLLHLIEVVLELELLAEEVIAEILLLHQPHEGVLFGQGGLGRMHELFVQVHQLEVVDLHEVLQLQPLCLLGLELLLLFLWSERGYLHSIVDGQAILYLYLFVLASGELLLAHLHLEELCVVALPQFILVAVVDQLLDEGLIQGFVVGPPH